jgi:hypothetical protein
LRRLTMNICSSYRRGSVDVCALIFIEFAEA